MDYSVAIQMTEFVAHDVKRFIVSKPDGFSWQPGQGVELFVKQPEVGADDGRPFTPTSLTDDRVLEFIIKRYPDHHGVTDKLHTLKAGDELLMSKPFGAITYKGPGTFIAAGAGITPFLAIVRQLVADGKMAGNRLLFSNKSAKDVICEKELRQAFGDSCRFTCTREQAPVYDHQRIDKDYLIEHVGDFDQHFYICGPDQFVEAINNILAELGAAAERLVFEE